jgi:hypothetical protein
MISLWGSQELRCSTTGPAGYLELTLLTVVIRRGQQALRDVKCIRVL